MTTREEALVEAFARGLMSALLGSPSAPVQRGQGRAKRRGVAPAAREAQGAGASPPPTLFDAVEPGGAVRPAPSSDEPVTAAELDRILAGFSAEDADRALQGMDPPDTYRPDEGVAPWMAS